MQKYGEIKDLVNAVLESYDKYPVIQNIDCRSRINSESVNDLLENIEYNLTKQVMMALPHSSKYREADKETLMESAREITHRFLEKIPKLRDVLATDVQAGYEGDPAAFNTDEVIFSYPGMYAITVNRIAHELYLLGVPLIPRMMTEHAHSLTGIDIHPGASIGEYFFIDHGTGVVVGETTVIGKYVKIYQGVTLGALSTRGGQSLRGVKRHPTLEDNVTVYSGASILGGETVIGTGAVIGSNAFITSSVPAQTRVSIKNPELQFKDRSRKASELGQEGFFNRKEED